MAEETDTLKVHQHLFSDKERITWKVVDTAVVSATSVTTLIQNNQEWCIDTFDYDENEYKRGKRICLHTILEEPPLLLSYVHAENKLKHFVCTKTKLHLIDDESESIEKSVPLSAVPSALCVEDNKVYISTNETKTLMFFKLEIPTDTSKINLNDISKRDSIAEFVVHSKNIYVCTKGGKVSSHKETGEKQHDYKNRKSKNSKARGLAVFTPQGKECNLLLVTWNDSTLYIYSTKTKHDLVEIDLNVPGKLRVTTSCFLMSSEVNDVAVYNMKTVADRGALKMILGSGNWDKDLSYLYDILLQDTTNEEALARNVLIKRKTLLTLVKMYEYSCKTNDNLTAEKKKLKHEIDRSKKEKDDLTEELENTRSKFFGKEADLSNLKTELDDGGITKDAVGVSTENMKTDLRGLIDGILDDTMELMKQKNDATKELEITKSTLTKKEEDRSQIQVELDAAISNKMDLEKTVTKSEELYRIIQAKEREIQQLRVRLEIAQTEVENAKTQVTILQDRKQNLENSLSREQKRSKELKNFLLNFKDRIKDLEFTRKELESQQKKLKDNLVQEKENVAREERSSVEVVINLKKVEDRNIKLEYEVTQLKERLLAEEMTAKELQTSSTKLIERIKELEGIKVQEKGKLTREERSRVQLIDRIKELEGIKTALESQQKKLKDNLVQEKGKITREERSRVQLIDRIKELEGIKTALESQQKKLTDNLVKEKGKITREERSRVQLNERMKELEFTRKELESQQKKLKDNLVKEKGKVSRVERSRVQLKKQIKELELTRTELESQRKKLKGNLVQEKGKVARKEISRVQAVTNLKKVEEINTKLEDQVTQLKDRLLAEELTAKDLQTSFLKILQDLDRDALILKRESEVFKEILQTEGTQKDVLVCLQSESSEKLKVLQQSAFLESVDALVKEISNGKSKLGKLKNNRDRNVDESEVQKDWFELSELQVSMVVSQDGGKLVIPGSDVSLDIPPGALQEQREIQMKIIPHCLDPGCDSLSFSSNSSVVVELLPNNLQFQRTVHLRLPHCLHLNDKYNSLTDVGVLISHHEKGDTPKWDASTDTSCKLQKDHCVVRLNKFCWITYRVDDKVVTAKRLKIFTAGRDLELSDRVSEVEVGYFPDLPGSGEILRKNPNLSRGQIKPFLFQKNEEKSTLLISLQQVIPTEWKNNIELGDQQIISYQSICTGTEMSCPFHLQYTPEGIPSGKVPLCLFHITQKNAEQIHITFRPEVKCDED